MQKFLLIRSILIVLPIVSLLAGCKQPGVSLSGSITPYRHHELGELHTLPNRKTIANGQVVSMIQSSGQIVPGQIKVETPMSVGDPNGPDRICMLRVGTAVNISALVRTTEGENLAIVRILDPCVKKGETTAAGGVFEGYVRLEDITLEGVEEQSQPRIPQGSDPKPAPLETYKIIATNAFIKKAVQEENIGGAVTPTAPTGQIIDATNKNIAEIKSLIIADYNGKRGDTIQYHQKGCLGVMQAGGSSLQSKCDSSIRPTSPNQILPCNASGDGFRGGGHPMSLAVFGRAAGWKVTPLLGADPNSHYRDDDLKGSQIMCFGDPSCKERNKPTNMSPKTFSSTTVTANGNGLSFIPWKDIVVAPNNWSGGTNRGASRARFLVQGITSSGSSVGNRCVHEFSIISPIALDLSISQKPVRTVDGLGQKVRFDLDADGAKDYAGWIYPNMGLLAMDRNGNGKIDDGSELFGEHTDKKSYDNGYEALKTLDSDGNRYIDHRDAAFKKLQVWIDSNMDGETQRGELNSLSFHGITKISVDFVALAPNPNHMNQVKFKAKYFGPAHCAKTGCSSYDIFFGVESNVTSN